MEQSRVMQKIQKLSHERERLTAKEDDTGGLDTEGRRRLHQIEHDLQVLWDLRRRELAGEPVDLDEDYYDRYDRYTGSDSPGR